MDVQQLYKKGKLDDALNLVNHYLGSLPKGAWGRNVTQARFLKGIILTDQHKIPEAISVFQRLTQDYPSLPEPYNNLATLYASQGKYDVARDVLERGLHTDATYSALQSNLSDIYTKLSSQAYDNTLQNSQGKPSTALVKELCDSYGKLANQSVGRGKAARADADLVVLREVDASHASAAKPPAHVDIDEMAMAGEPESATAIKSAVQPAANASPKSIEQVAQPTPALSEKQLSVEDASAIKSLLHAWAMAWSAKNVNAYLGFYASDFQTPNHESRDKWAAMRRERISKPKSIRVDIESPDIHFVDANHVHVNFKQSYRSDNLQATGRKIMTMVKVKTKWLIQEERAG